MRIAFLTTDNREHDRKYNVPDPYFGTAPAALIQGFSQIEGIEVHVISCLQKTTTSPKKLAANIWFHPITVPKAGWLRSGYLGCIFSVRKKLREIKPDLVHAQGTERDCAVSAAYCGYPALLTIHGNMRLISKLVKPKFLSFLNFQSKLEELVIPRFLGVVCITRFTREAVTGKAIRTWVVPNAVDAKYFTADVIVPNRNKRLIVVANILTYKNQNFFIQSLGDLPERAGFEVVFFGKLDPTSAYGREFETLLSRYRWAKYGGFLSQDALLRELEAATALALPTLADNCPMVVLESMAARVPVLASRIGGIPDLIDEGDTGLFCDPREASNIKSAVEVLMRDEVLRKKLASTAYDVALKRFHPIQVARQHLEIYRSVLTRDTSQKSSNG